MPGEDQAKFHGQSTGNDKDKLFALKKHMNITWFNYSWSTCQRIHSTGSAIEKIPIGRLTRNQFFCLSFGFFDIIQLWHHSKPLPDIIIRQMPRHLAIT
ncbi:MAG: hypothetical protein AB2L21_01350 [Anaerolineaceae bacterium]|jgi:hypothetical protein